MSTKSDLPHVLTPAAYVYLVFGGIKATARAIGIDHSAVSRWQNGSKRRNPGDIPSNAQRRVLDAAKERGLPITANDIFYGRTCEPVGGV